jgi:hypothetical protein
MNETVRKYLIEVARKRTNQTVHYQELCNECNLELEMSSPYDRGEIGKILGAISFYEDGYGRPLLSALVVRKGDNYEGDGFFKLAEELGYGSWKILKDSHFDIEKMNECIEFWKNEDNFKKFR